MSLKSETYLFITFIQVFPFLPDQFCALWDGDAFEIAACVAIRCESRERRHGSLDLARVFDGWIFWVSFDPLNALP